ncbi:hypothetical protein EI94DRAFT_1707501 [Lactarius quietus]|nr:hypothetical protein EI94DRAFT_1707501 [Lactarius quietus]
MTLSHVAKIRMHFSFLYLSLTLTIPPPINPLVPVCLNSLAQVVHTKFPSRNLAVEQEVNSGLRILHLKADPIITPIWFEWVGNSPVTGADEVVEDGGVEDKDGSVGEVVVDEGQSKGRR